MSLNDFISKYKLALLKGLIKISELSIYRINNELKVNDYLERKYRNVTNEKPRKFSQKEILEIAKNMRRNHRHGNPFLPDYVLLNNEDIEFLIRNKTDFKDISKAKGILWSEKIIEKHKHQWDWSSISRNSSLNWTPELIEKFNDYLDFKELSFNPCIVLNHNLFFKYIEKWDMNGICGNPAISKYIEEDVLNYPKSIWSSKPSYNYEVTSSSIFLFDLNSQYYEFKGNYWGIDPCICTNPSIVWDKNKFEKYKGKIDFWLLAMFGQIDDSVLLEYGSELNENREVSTEYTKFSDWRDSHPNYYNGWENLMYNSNLKINTKLLKYFAHQEVNLIEHTGDARSGHCPIEKAKRVNELIPANKISLKFDELIANIHLIPSKYITETDINVDIFLNIIHPEFQVNEALYKYLIDRI